MNSIKLCAAILLIAVGLTLAGFCGTEAPLLLNERHGQYRTIGLAFIGIAVLGAVLVLAGFVMLFRLVNTQKPG